jgi:hypothetical protein
MEVNRQLHDPTSLPGEVACSIHGIEGWVDHRVSGNVVKKKNVSCPGRESNPDPSVCQPVA